MAIVGFNESSLRNSEIYNTPYFIANNPLERVKKLEKTAQHLTNEDIELAYVQVKQLSNSLSREALKAFDNGSTVLLYNTDPKLSMVKIIPFMTLRKGNEYVTYVFMDQWIQRARDKSGKISINSAILHDLLVGAKLSTALKKDYSRLTDSQYLSKTLMSLYTSFVCRILNREYLLGSEKVIYDSIQYFTNRFFLDNILEFTGGAPEAEALAKSHFKYIDPMKYDEIKIAYDSAKPTNISDLLKLIKTLNPRMGNLDSMKFINNWINYFYPPSAMAIDNIEYLLFMIVTLKNDNIILNHGAASIVKETKNIKSLEQELLKLI